MAYPINKLHQLNSTDLIFFKKFPTQPTIFKVQNCDDTFVPTTICGHKWWYLCGKFSAAVNGYSCSYFSRVLPIYIGREFGPMCLSAWLCSKITVLTCDCCKCMSANLHPWNQGSYVKIIPYICWGKYSLHFHLCNSTEANACVKMRAIFALLAQCFVMQVTMETLG